MRLVVLATLIACGSPKHAPPPARAINVGVVEGQAIDAQTGAGVPGVEVMFGGPCRAGEEVGWAITDEHGHYRIELGPGVCSGSASFGERNRASVEIERVEIVRGRTTSLDLRFDHDQLEKAWTELEPLNCPSSPPKAIIEGHTMPRGDLDDIASAVLARYEGTTRIVSVDVGAGSVSGPSGRLRPETWPKGFVAKTAAQLQAEADRTKRDVRFIRFASIDSDGTCAIIYGGDFSAQPSTSHGMRCGCINWAIYEKRDGRWTFVRERRC